MLRVTINEVRVDEKAGISAKTGKPYSIRTQEVQLETARFRVPARITLGDRPSPQEPYAPGVYEIKAEDAISVGRYGDLELARVIPLHRISDLPKARATA